MEFQIKMKSIIFRKNNLIYTIKFSRLISKIKTHSYHLFFQTSITSIEKLQ